MKPAEAKATLVRSGILTADGKLTPPYGGDEGADEVVDQSIVETDMT